MPPVVGPTNKRRLARVVNVEQVAVEVQVFIPPHLHRSVGGLLGHITRGKLKFGEQAKWWHSHF